MDSYDIELEGGETGSHQAEVDRRIKNLQIDKSDISISDFKIEPLDCGEALCLFILNFFFYILTGFFAACAGFYTVEPK